VKAASAKAKGTRLEKWVESKLKSIGFYSRRQPGSGIYSDFKHDNYCVMPGVGPMIIECKSWKNGWRTGDKAMGVAELLVIKRDFGEPCVYMPWTTFEQMCAALQTKANEESSDLANDV